MGESIKTSFMSFNIILMKFFLCVLSCKIFFILTNKNTLHCESHVCLENIDVHTRNKNRNTDNISFGNIYKI